MNLCDDLFIEIIELSDNLHVKQVCKRCINIFHRYTDIIYKITVNNVYKNKLSNIPYRIISDIMQDTNLFTDILKKSELFVSVESETEILYNRVYGWVNWFDLPNFKYVTIKRNCINEYHITKSKTQYKIEKINYSNKELFTNMIIDNEPNHDKIVSFIIIFRAMCPYNYYSYNNLAISNILSYCACSNKFELYKKIFVAVPNRGLYDDIHMRHFIKYQNMDAIRIFSASLSHF